MTIDLPSARIGVLAGGGSLPREIAESIVARGGTVQIVALRGEADADFAPFPHLYIAWGQIGRMMAAFRDAGCSDLVIIGRVRRPDLFRVRLDLGALLALPAIVGIVRSGGDDHLLRRVARFFETRGLRLIGAGAAAPELVLAAGDLVTPRPAPDDANDIVLALRVLERLAPFDVGQAVIVRDGRIAAVEGAEGTDGMLARVAPDPTARRGVLVKAPKVGQELRIDLPAIGPETVSRAAAAGLSGLAATAGHVLMAGRAELIARAEAQGLFVHGLKPPSPEIKAPGRLKRPRPRPAMLTRFGRVVPRDRDRVDAALGVMLMNALAEFDAGQAVVVARGHILALSSDEAAAAMLTRAGTLRQWGKRTFGTRIGVGVVRPSGEKLVQLVAAAAASELAGLVILGGKADGPAIDAADRYRLFLCRLEPDRI